MPHIHLPKCIGSEIVLKSKLTSVEGQAYERTPLLCLNFMSLAFSCRHLQSLLLDARNAFW